jgi:hypothetical protein
VKCECHLASGFILEDNQTRGGLCFADAAVAELLYVAEGALERTLKTCFIAQFELQILMQQFDFGLVGLGGAFGFEKSDLSIGDGSDGEAQQAVVVDYESEQTRGGGAGGIVFGGPDVPDGIVVFLCFAGEEFIRIASKTVFGGIFTGVRFSGDCVGSGFSRWSVVHLSASMNWRRSRRAAGKGQNVQSEGHRGFLKFVTGFPGTGRRQDRLHHPGILPNELGWVRFCRL